MKTYCTLLSFLLCALVAQAQDIIVTVTGEEIHAKVEEITLTHLLYRLPDSASASPLSIPKAEVFMVKYANGEKEVLAQEPAEEAEEVLTPQQMAALGRRDARLYYKGNGAMWGSAGSILVLSLAGPILIGAIPPKIDAQEVSNVTYLASPDYTRAYKRQAHKRKVGKAALGGAIGIGTLYMAAAILFSNISY